MSDKTEVNHIDIAKSEVVKAKYQAGNTQGKRDMFDAVISVLSDKQKRVRQIPKKGSQFIFQCTGCGKDYVNPPSLPAEECSECGSMVHMVEMPADAWDDKYEVKR